MLTIVRGLPGSGKTTFAMEHVRIVEDNTEDQIVHLEADMFWMVDGEYRFDRSKARFAHEWCQNMVAYYLQRGIHVVVSNTFTRINEILPYIMIANDYGVPYEIIECTGNYGSVHNVPEDVLEAMKERWEDLPFMLYTRQWVETV